MLRQKGRFKLKWLLAAFFCFFWVFTPLHSQARLGEFTIRGLATQEMENAGLVAAHPSLPINSDIKIRNPRNGHEIEATVIDRIQPSLFRIVDLSREAAVALGLRSGDRVILSTFTLPPVEKESAIVNEVESTRGTPASVPSVPSAASGDDILIHIAPVIATAEQAAFLQEQFEAEAAAGGYNLTRNRNDADYILNLEVRPNTILRNDGTESPAPSGEKRYRLNFTLDRNEDNIEIVAFSFLFTELNEINAYIPYLFDEAMAIVPAASRQDTVKEIVRVEEVEVVRQVLVEEPVSWRNKWLYLRVSADVPVNYYKVKPGGLLNGSHIYNEEPPRQSRLDDQFIMVPGATVGLEVQFLNFMSAAVNFEMRFADVSDYALIPGASLQLKFPIKPARHFMLEPYIAGSYSMNMAEHSVSFPAFAVGGGFQFGVKGGNNGALFLDVNYMHSLGEVRAKNIVENYPKPDELHWDRFVIGLGIGYKIGFIDRRR